MYNRPNILLVMADNHPANLLGCYGNEEIYTPHIDQRAAESQIRSMERRYGKVELRQAVVLEKSLGRRMDA